MLKPFSAVFFTVALAGFAGGAQAQGPERPTTLVPAAAEAAGFSDQRLQRLHGFMRQSTGPTAYLGGVTLIARNGRIIDWQAYGHRNLQRSEAMRKDDIFRIYSMTKTVTAVAVLMLVEEGRLSLDDPVALVLPALGNAQVLVGGSAAAPQLRAAARPITIRHLLTHTDGFAAGLPGEDAATRLLERSGAHAMPDLESFAARLQGLPLAADPGTRFGYDGAGSEVLARVVEQVSAQSFEDFLRQRIFEPLRMHDTAFRVPESSRERVVDITTMGPAGRLVLDEGPSAVRPGEPLNGYASGAGGLYSTAGDYARFCQMLLDGGTLDGAAVLGRKTVDLMFLNQLTMLERPVTQFSDAEGFGLGGYVVTDVARRGSPASPGLFGWSGAASTNFMIDRQERLVAILLLQHLPSDAAGDLPRIGRKFQTLVYQGLVP